MKGKDQFSEVVENCLKVIEKIDNYHKAGFNEMTPFMHQLTIKAVEVLERQPKNETIDKALEKAYFLLKHMPELVLHKI